MRILVTGGAGYIGSHTVVALINAGHDVEIIDSFINASPAVIDRLETITGVRPPVHDFDVRDRAETDRILDQGAFEAVIHFAGLKAVGESVTQPLRYYDHNIGATCALVESMSRHNVTTLVFSSSATVYGDQAPVPYVEGYGPLNSTNPYGQTKVMIERILCDVADAEPQWRIALLRYFNPVGAHPSGLIGEDPQGIPNNLMPFISQVAVGRRDHLEVFGDDYDTADGTPERDYIHVDDLAAGHMAALDVIAGSSPGTRVWNWGTGRATSVLEMVSAFERATGQNIPYRIASRRPGDLAVTYADAGLAERELNWRANHGIDDMCADTWNWQSKNPQGYPE